MAYDEHAIKLLRTGLEIDNHIAFIVIQKEQTYLLTEKLFHSVHCVIVKDIGILLSSTCSSITEGLLDKISKWAYYLYPKNNVQFYMKY
jgi:hypothetical protein